jgi:hypothetical protein
VIREFVLHLSKRNLFLLVRITVFLISICQCDGSFDLLLSAEVQNVKKISVSQDHAFFLHLRCTNCHETFPSAVGVSKGMSVEGIRGASVNLQVRHPLFNKLDKIKRLTLASIPSGPVQGLQACW